MPRPDGIPGAEGLPLWDTVEAVYFLVAGFTAGVVIGFLFPSLWRAFRRRFRNTARYSASGGLSPELEVSHRVLGGVEDVESDEGRGQGLEHLFVVARDMVQTGRARDAVQTYLEILGNERVSKQATNRALFELSQAYVALGLLGRAYDTAFELLNRKPALTEVFEHLLSLTVSMGRWERLDVLLRTWKGETDGRLRLRIAHCLCLQGEGLVARESLEGVRDIAMRAARWDLKCGRARILLWSATSREMWRKCDDDWRMKWSALAADLEARLRIHGETGVSAAAGASVLKGLLLEMSGPEALSSLPAVRGEVDGILGLRDAAGEASLNEILLFSSLCEGRGHGEEAACLELAHLLSPTFPPFEPLRRQAEALSLFSRGLAMHRCKECGHVVPCFAWECPACRMPEALWPETRLFRPLQPANLSSERA